MTVMFSTAQHAVLLDSSGFCEKHVFFKIIEDFSSRSPSRHKTINNKQIISIVFLVKMSHSAVSPWSALSGCQGQLFI